MSHQYERPAAGPGLRLHLNENTAGCSPRVIEAMRAITREQAASYPDYDRATAACAKRYGIREDQLLLTNGLDEGILLTALVALRGSPASEPYEGIVVQPAFDMYAACTDAAGGRVIAIPPEPDFSFPRARVEAAITPRTRVIFLTNPNNPTGISISESDILAVAAAAPHALVLLDEAYADFAGRTMLDRAAAGTPRNLIVGRTFAKAYGLAGVRVGALIAAPETLAPMRRAIPPYSINVYAAAALPVAFDDLEYYDWYLEEVRASKALLYDVLSRRGVRYWPSDGNFVLACFGDALPEVISQLAARGLNVRDRSGDPGCAGCARLTAGVTEHTRQLATALEEVLCGAR